MAKSSSRKRTPPTKKHIARLERERMQTRLITISAIIVIVLVVGVIGYGILDQRVLRGLRPVAIVNGEEISTNEFRAYTKYYRAQLIQNAQNVIQFANLLGSDPGSQSTITNQLLSIENDLDAFRAGNAALDQMIESTLIRQEAERMGITVSAEELEKKLEEAMGYYADGTPTPTATIEVRPTSTLSDLQLTLMPPTATLMPTIVPTTTAEISPTLGSPAVTLTPTEVLTPTATAAPTASPTPYTFEAFQSVYATQIASFEEVFGVPEETLKYIIETQIYRDKLMEVLFGDLACEEEQVWAQHILLENEETAREIHQILVEGEDWNLAAKTFSTDTSNKNNSGDLGWFGRGQMVSEFEEVAFSLEVGEISEPVQTDFGWHIIRVLGHENQPLDARACQTYKSSQMREWVAEQRENSDIDLRDDYWQTVVPLLPTLPPEIQQIVEQIQPEIPSDFLPTQPPP
jgi:parvulin-like peptidyl-prolyl isomerase